MIETNVARAARRRRSSSTRSRSTARPRSRSPPIAATCGPDPLFSPTDAQRPKATGRSRRSPTSSSRPPRPDLAKVGIAALKRIRRDRPGPRRAQRRHHRHSAARRTSTLARADARGRRLRPDRGRRQRRTTTPDRDTVPCYYVPGQPRVLPRERPGHARRRGWPSSAQPYRHVRPQGHALHPAQLDARHAARLGLRAAADAAGRRSTTRATDAAVEQRDGLRAPPDQRPGRARRVASSATATRSQLIEKLLTDFRETSGKGVAMVGSHAQIANVHRDRGRALHGAAVLGQGAVRHAGPRRLHRLGATGVSTRDAAPRQQWLTADVRAFAQSIDARRARARSRPATSAQLERLDRAAVGREPTARASCRCATRCRSAGAARTTLAIGGRRRRGARAPARSRSSTRSTRKLTALRAGRRHGRA